MDNEFSRVISKTHLLRFVYFFFFSFSSFSLSFNFVRSLLSFVLLQLNQQFFAMILFLLRPGKKFQQSIRVVGRVAAHQTSAAAWHSSIVSVRIESDEGVGEDSEGEELDS